MKRKLVYVAKIRMNNLKVKHLKKDVEGTYLLDIHPLISSFFLQDCDIFLTFLKRIFCVSTACQIDVAYCLGL